jgi:hypothetical protein
MTCHTRVGRVEKGADFATAWQTDSADAAFRDEGVRRWRQQSRKRLAM